MGTYIAGYSLGISLILAIGSQNAFILKQGLKKQHVFAVCLICAISDAILISSGVLGFGAVVKQYPSIEQAARYGGAIFLTLYALMSFRSAFTNKHCLSLTGDAQTSLRRTIIFCLAFTWLNPHVYLDTVVLLGSISTKYHPQQMQFAVGAVLASVTFFFSLGYGARYLAPLFAKDRAWQILEGIVGVIMLLLAVSLLNG